MKVFMDAQGSPAWADMRAGKVTGSRMVCLLTDKREDFSETSARTLAYELVAETLIGGVDPWKHEGETADMRRGLWTEQEARSFVEFTRGVKIDPVGMCIHDNDRWSCSPDGLIGDSEGIEIKCPAPKTQVKWLLDGGIPLEHRAQCHGGLIVTGKARWSFLSYCVGLPPLEVVITPDAFTAKLEAALVRFNGIFDDMLSRIRAQRDEAISDAIQRKGDQLPPDLRGLVPAANQLEESYF